MRESKYNYFFEHESLGSIAFNLRTTALTQLDEQAMGIIRANRSAPYTPKADTRELCQQLLAHGFLVEDACDEVKLLQIKANTARFQTTTLALVLAPTAACNFACSYCFENEGKTTMSTQTQDSIMSYLEDNLKFVRRLELRWYGGEPLLALDIINSLSERILACCQEHKVEYCCSMISNGYLLDSAAIALLNKVKCQQIQITLDGLAPVHDTRRVLKNGGGTFQTIASNIVAALSSYEGKILLRVNTDKSNLTAYDEIKGYFSAFPDPEEKLHVYQAFVNALNDKELSYCLSDAEMVAKDKQKFTLPEALTLVCAYDYNNSLVINADGQLYKCYTDLGRDALSFGNINDPDAVNEAKQYAPYLQDVFADPECRACYYLPICLGGCPTARQRGHKVCCSTKHEPDTLQIALNNYIDALE